MKKGLNGVTYDCRWLPPSKYAGRRKEVKNVPAEKAIVVILDGMRALVEDASAETVAILNETASDVQGAAIENAPVYLGALRQSIGVRVGADGAYSREVYAGGKPAPYAPFMEYGTSGGAPPLEEIKEWMRLKGIPALTGDEDKSAWLIRRKIMARGVRAQPFLFPAFERFRGAFLDRIRRAFG